MSDYSPQRAANNANGDDVYSRDAQILSFMGGASAVELGADAWRHQREFLERFRPLLNCIGSYIGQSKDRSMIAVTLARKVHDAGWKL